MPPARAAVRPRNSPDRINARPAARDGNKAGARSCRECRMCDSSSEVLRTKEESAMSKKTELRADLNRIGYQLGGAHLTQDARRATFNTFAQAMHEKGYGIQ